MGVGDQAVDHVLASGIETIELANEIAIPRSSGYRNVLERVAQELWERDDGEVDNPVHCGSRAPSADVLIRISRQCQQG